ncbi:MAG: B12-binding domain-containing radical SAM protein, partial [Thermoplasmatales archaeon]|nr:B12-binding domain-containing radical SAM protein [Thermoplasmatales archaeon]
MKVLLVNPHKDAFGFKPIGISLLSAIAKDVDWDTALYDTTEIKMSYDNAFKKHQEARHHKPVDYKKYNLIKKEIDIAERTREVIKQHKPDLLALSVLTDQFKVAKTIAMVAKQYQKDLPILWGGTHATSNPNDLIKNDFVDYMCVGEGLEAFRDFLEAFQSGSDLLNIKNIWGKNGKEVVKNELRPLKKNLDDLPYLDWTIFDKRQFCKPFHGKIYVGGEHMTNWGCPNKCTYCINHYLHDLYKDVGGYNMRRYTNKRIIKELKWLVKEWGIEFIKFFDEDFLMRPFDNLEELSNMYRDEVNVPFWIETNSMMVTEDRVKLLKNMNCAGASLGVETGFPIRKELLLRKDTEDDIRRAFSLLKKYDMKTTAFNMLGLPFETRETYMSRIELNRIANAQSPSISFFYPFKNTKLREISEENGFFDPINEEDHPWNPGHPNLHFPYLSDEELIQMRLVFTLYVKLPKLYW